MRTASFIVLSSLGSLLFGASAFATESAAPCTPHVQNARTDFPSGAQRQGAHGTVLADIRIANDGAIASAIVSQSSGYAVLDRAAIASIEKHWRFDVSQCSRQDLEQPFTVSVSFEPTKSETVSGTIDGKSLARTAELRDDARCSAVDQGRTITIFSCVKNLSLERTEQRAAR